MLSRDSQRFVHKSLKIVTLNFGPQRSEEQRFVHGALRDNFGGQETGNKVSQGTDTEPVTDQGVRCISLCLFSVYASRNEKLAGICRSIFGGPVARIMIAYDRELVRIALKTLFVLRQADQGLSVPDADRAFEDQVLHEDR
jgi:hypothetical protein